MAKRRVTSQKFRCVILGNWLPYSERTRWKMITWPIWWGDISTGLLCCFHTNPSKIGLIVTFTLQPLFRRIYIAVRSIALLKSPYQSVPTSWFLESGHFYKSFREIQSECKGDETFWVVPAGNFREQRNTWKGSPYVCLFAFFISSKPSLIPVSVLRGRFSVNGSDLYKW